MLLRNSSGIAVLALLSGAFASANAQLTTMGLFANQPGSFDGYTLIESMFYETTYLINNEGRICHFWDTGLEPAYMSYVLENGDLGRSAHGSSNPAFPNRRGGTIQRFDWDGNLLWEYVYSDSLRLQHHDIEWLPNGNVLVMGWERKTQEEAIAAGRDPGLLPGGELWPTHLVEVEPVGATGGNIVWEWHVWDHLIQDFDDTKDNFGVVADHPELMDVNFVLGSGADWLHENAVDYNPQLDQIVICFRHISEFWIIDHSTTTEEAAGHTGGLRGMGGDILYRWGNPQVYDRGTAADQKLYLPHDAHWIEPGLPGEGRILLFNNGNQRPEGNYSTVEEIVTTVDGNGDYPVPAAPAPHGPADAQWTYVADPPADLWSSFVSGAQRQPNGNTLICEGAVGTIREVDLKESIVWLYVNPVGDDGPQMQGDPPVQNTTFRAERYAPEYPAFDGRDLSPGPPIEIYSTTGVGELVALPRFTLRGSYPNPFRSGTSIEFSLRGAAFVKLDVYRVDGRRVTTLVNGPLGAGEHRVEWIADRAASGVYHYALRIGEETATGKMILSR